MRFTQAQVRDAREARRKQAKNDRFRRDMKWLAAGLGWGCVIGFSVACTLVVAKIITLPR